MLRLPNAARRARCCGPENCGMLDEQKGVRVCEGEGCMAWRMYRFPDGLGPVGCDETDTLGYCGLVGKPDVPYFLWKLDDELTPEPADTAIDTIPAGEWDIATKAGW